MVGNGQVSRQILGGGPKFEAEICDKKTKVVQDRDEKKCPPNLVRQVPCSGDFLVLMP